MKFALLSALLSVLLLPALASAGVFSSETIQTYPSSWPTLAGMSANCAEVQGAYIDPNERRWAYEQLPTSSLGGKSGGSYEAIWYALGLPAKEVQADVRHPMPRSFSIELAADQTVTVRYMIGETQVSSRSFAKGEWSCGADGLALTVIDRKGAVGDKVPSHGHIVNRAFLYRMNEHIYVKSERRSTAWLLHVVPQSFHDVEWLRFIGERQRPSSALDAGAVLRVNAAKKAFYEKYLPANGSKAFAQAPDGSWGWAVGRTSPRVAAEDAVAACSMHVKPHNKPCAVVHLDDWWTVSQ